jgi:hypothetical protein
MGSITTAADMARLRGIDPKRFRTSLRRAGLQWHSHNGLWEVRVGSAEHRDLLCVLATLGDAPTVRVAARRLPDGNSREFHALRYVALNPVRARLVARAEDWAWSSTRAQLAGQTIMSSRSPRRWSGWGTSPRSWARTSTRR